MRLISISKIHILAYIITIIILTPILPLTEDVKLPDFYYTAR